MKRPDYKEMARYLLNLNMGLWLVPWGTGKNPIVSEYWSPMIDEKRGAIGSLEHLSQSPQEKWGWGLGVVLPLSRLVMVDIDKHAEEANNGFTSLALLQERYGELPLTWGYSTPGKGQHWLYRLPDDFPLGFGNGTFAPGVELKYKCATPLPPTPRYEKRNPKSDYHKEVGYYEWLTNVDFDNEDYEQVMYRPGEIALAVLPEWLTIWAKSPKIKLVSTREYYASLNTEAPAGFQHDTRQSIGELFQHEHKRSPLSTEELTRFQQTMGSIATILDPGKSQRTGEKGTRKYPRRTVEQVEEFISSHSALAVEEREDKGRYTVWSLKHCPLERGHSKAEADGNPCISYDHTTQTAMFHCFETKCVALVEDTYDRDWWKALCDALGEDIPGVSGEEVLELLQIKAGKRQPKSTGKERLKAIPKGADLPAIRWEDQTRAYKEQRLREVGEYVEILKTMPMYTKPDGLPFTVSIRGTIIYHFADILPTTLVMALNHLIPMNLRPKWNNPNMVSILVGEPQPLSLEEAHKADEMKRMKHNYAAFLANTQQN